MNIFLVSQFLEIRQNIAMNLGLEEHNEDLEAFKLNNLQIFMNSLFG
jgi:hypothetical protein